MLGLFGGSFDQIMFQLIVRVLVVLTVIPMQQFAQAFVACKLGDDTPRWSGQLTISPLKHLDLMGAIAMVLVGIGWGKPVNINPYNFKNRRSGIVWTTLAGPIANILMATVFLLVFNTVDLFYGVLPAQLYTVIQTILSIFIQINISLAVFQILPIPGLPGYRVLSQFLPSKVVYQISQYERYMFFVLLILLATGILSYPISFLSNLIVSFLSWLTALPFLFFR